MPRDDPRFTLWPAKGRCTGPSLSARHVPHHQARDGGHGTAPWQQHVIHANLSGGGDASRGVVNVVLGQVGCMPGNSAVVGIVVEDSQAVVGRSGGDDEVHR